MVRPFARLVAACAAGVLFGAGLAWSQMIDPRVVLAFLDVAAISGGGWNPALALVMAVAVAVTFVGYRVVFHRPRPLLAATFAIPTRRAVDRRLVTGALLFGIGWGLAGYCPGPAIAGLAFAPLATWVFLAAMLAGMGLYRLLYVPREHVALFRSVKKESKPMLRNLFTVLCLAGLLAAAPLATMPARADTHPPLFVNLISDEGHRVTMALTFAGSQLDRGHPLTLWLNDKAVMVATKKAGGPFAEQQALLAALIAKGATVIVCPLCMKHYGVAEAELIEGAKVGNPDLTGDLLFKEGTQTLTW